MVERFVIGRKLAFVVSSNPDFLSIGVICPIFILFGKRPLENDAFAIFVIMVIISGTNNLSKDVGSRSSGDDLFGSFLIALITSSVITTPKSVKLAANKLGVGSSVVGSSHDAKVWPITSVINCNFSQQNSLNPVATSTFERPPYRDRAPPG